MYGIPGDAVKHGIWNNRITGNENCWHCTWNCHPASTDNCITFKLGLEMAFFFSLVCTYTLCYMRIIYSSSVFQVSFKMFQQQESACLDWGNQILWMLYIIQVTDLKWRSKSSIFQTESTSHPLSHVHTTVQFCTVVVSFPDSSEGWRGSGYKTSTVSEMLHANRQ